MRVSKLFGKTLRDDPAEAELDSHRLMLKAGIIYQVASGVYSYLPLAWRSLRKIEQIIREEMDAAGGQEVRLSVLQPLELWKQSGRAEMMGENLMTLREPPRPRAGGGADPRGGPDQHRQGQREQLSRPASGALSDPHGSSATRSVPEADFCESASST